MQYDIDRIGTQLRNLANMVDYATIDLTLLGPVASVSSQGTTFGERIKVLFSGFGDFLSVLVTVILGIIIYGLPIVLLLFFFYWVRFGRIGLLKKLVKVTGDKKEKEE